ncbi:hypothetical protein B0H10DRAFT_1841054 [Mycena sp. CBHHK59/15]|nr:hypothetical protein B0H10DRAFT_1841054 [Mycena sp. CBHHK59/15]
MTKRSGRVDASSHFPSSSTNAKAVSRTTSFFSSSSSSLPLVLLLFLVLSLTHPQDDDTTGHLQKMRAQVGSSCLVATGIVAEILLFYAGFKYSYRRGLDNILVLLIGDIPIVMLTVLSVMLGVTAQQLAKHKTIVIRITAFEELTGVTILCSDKTIRSPRTSLRWIGRRFDL